MASIDIQRTVSASPVNVFQSQVTLRDGQVLVLGQAGFAAGAQEGFPGDTTMDPNASLFYIVSVDPV